MLADVSQMCSKWVSCVDKSRQESALEAAIFAILRECIPIPNSNFETIAI
jgi:hypothetical protein